MTRKGSEVRVLYGPPKRRSDEAEIAQGHGRDVVSVLLARRRQGAPLDQVGAMTRRTARPATDCSGKKTRWVAGSTATECAWSARWAWPRRRTVRLCRVNTETVPLSDAT